MKKVYFFQLNNIISLISLLVLTSDYLSCASRLVVADLIIKIFFENVSDAELLPTIIDGG